LNYVQVVPIIRNGPGPIPTRSCARGNPRFKPRAAFPYAFNSGADFILVGMFDWQVAEDANLARRVVNIIRGPGSKRTRPWC
jgi:hypothetical protein